MNIYLLLDGYELDACFLQQQNTLRLTFIRTGDLFKEARNVYTELNSEMTFAS